MKLIVLAAYTKSLLNFRVPLMRAFLERGWEVVAAGPGEESEWGPRFAKHGVRFQSIPLSRNGLNPLADGKTYFFLKGFFRKEQPDQLFCSQAKAVVYGVPAARAVGVPGIHALISGLGSVFHGSGLKNALVRTVLEWEYQCALKKADTVFFQNEDDRGTFFRKKLVDPAKTVMIHGSGVDVAKFIPTPFPEKTTFTIVTRVLRDKGVCEFLEAARILKSRHPECRFVLAGPYDTNPSALSPKDIQPYLDDHTVDYLGELEDVRPALADSTVFVFPSYHEGTPMCVLEAMACGRPVVTTDASGCRETVREGENGYLVPVKNVESLVAAMERFLKDPSLCQSMGAASRKFAETIFASEHVNAAIMGAMGVE